MSVISIMVLTPIMSVLVFVADPYITLKWANLTTAKCHLTKAENIWLIWQQIYTVHYHESFVIILRHSFLNLWPHGVQQFSVRSDKILHFPFLKCSFPLRSIISSLKRRCSLWYRDMYIRVYVPFSPSPPPLDQLTGFHKTWYELYHIRGQNGIINMEDARTSEAGVTTCHLFRIP